MPEETIREKSWTGVHWCNIQDWTKRSSVRFLNVLLHIFVFLYLWGFIFNKAYHICRRVWKVLLIIVYCIKQCAYRMCIFIITCFWYIYIYIVLHFLCMRTYTYHTQNIKESPEWRPEGRLNIKIPSYQYRDSHIKDKTVTPTVLSLTWESPYLGKTVFILRRGPGYNTSHILISMLWSKLRRKSLKGYSDIYLRKTLGAHINLRI